MKAFSNANARDVKHAVTLLQQAHQQGHTASVAGGGSDLLQLMKERTVAPDVLINLKSIRNLDHITVKNGGFAIGGLTTLSAIARDAGIRQKYAVLAEAAESVATPQIRNVGTIAGNVSQRPWCWYYRNNFPCLKNGGRTCFSVTGENEFHAILGGGPSYIVHPSDTASALVALEATFKIVGPSGERSLPAGEFFALPTRNPARENVLEPEEILTEVTLPALKAGTRSTYHKVMDREAWTHAVVAAAVVLEMDRDVCRRARIVLSGVAPIPWRAAEAEAILVGQRVTPEIAAKVGEAAVANARPLAKNGYKVPLTSAVVRRTLSELAARA
jgi:xanthine dehydrogenase YagS FAD-binding subunit